MIEDETEVDQGFENESFVMRGQAAVADHDKNSCFINKDLY